MNLFCPAPDFSYLCTTIHKIMKYSLIIPVYNRPDEVAELLESDIVEVVSDADTNTILYAEMPVKTVLRVTHSEPGIKGDTATNATKLATLETGVEIRVPLFINEGDLIQVDTRDGSYLQRMKE